MKASARGTPAKFEATPENVIRAVRSTRGRPPRITADASRNPKNPPAIAVTRLISMLLANAPGMIPVDRSA